MLQLSAIERIIVWLILAVSLLGAMAGAKLASKQNLQMSKFLVSLAGVSVALESLLIIFRNLEIGTFAISGIFDSMIMLLIAFGITFLFLAVFIRQILFLCVMSWTHFALVLLTVFIAVPAQQLQPQAKTPWAVFHAVSMSTAGAMIIFASAMSLLFLLSIKKLKSKQFTKLKGSVPNLEKLEMLNLLGIKTCFVLLTFGLVSGIGLAVVRSASLNMALIDWIADSKIVLISSSWLMLAVILTLRYFFNFKGKFIAQLTIVVSLLILFAFIGSNVFCKSNHDFRHDVTPVTNLDR